MEESILQFINRKTKKEWKSDEICLRSCWRCNKAHKHLMDSSYPIYCFACGRIYYNGKELRE